MKTADTIKEFAQSYARGILRGTKTPLDVRDAVTAMKGEAGHVAAAIFVLEIASMVPDSVEVQLREVLAESVAMPAPVPVPVEPPSWFQQASDLLTRAEALKADCDAFHARIDADPTAWSLSLGESAQQARSHAYHTADYLARIKRFFD